MRTFTRKLLSLLLAFTMVCAMVPAALADTVETDPDEGTGEQTGDPVQNPDGEDDNDNDTDDPDPTQPPEGHEGLGNHSESTAWGSDSENHWHTCTVSGCPYKYDEKTHSWDEGTPTTKPTCAAPGVLTKTCSDCKATKTGAIAIDPTAHTWKYKAISTTEHEKWCTNPNCSSATPVREAHTSTDSCSYCNYSSDVTLSISQSPSSRSFKYDYNEDVELEVIATVKNGSFVVDDKSYDIEYYWSGDCSDRDHNTAYLDTYYSSADASCEVVVYVDGEEVDSATAEWHGTLDDTITVNVTVYNTGNYALGDKDADGEDSVVDQIYDAIDEITDRDEELSYVIFEEVSSSRKGELDADEGDKYFYDNDLEDVTFTAEEDYKGNVSFDFTAYDGHKNAYPGTINFKVEEGTASAGDIIYTAKNGEDVEFDVDDFEDFWDDNSSKGSLDYVMFDSVSSSKGDLVDEDGKDVSTKTKYYVDPGNKQIALDGITFEPARNLKTAVTIDFTAYGTNKKSVSGTVVILYTEKEPEAIVYSSTGKNITLDRDDFLDNYEDTVGSSASNIQIQFLDAPSNGTLYYNYNEKTEKGTELTSKNVQNYTFSTNTRASRSIEDVTYVPDSRGRADTIKFACYTSSGELRYYGEVTFGQTVRNVSVSMTSTSAGVTFQTSSFTGADSAMLTVSSISFGTPSSGTLYKNWTGTSGTRVTASDMFSYVASVTGNPSLSTVTYVPVAGYSGNVTIPFSAYSTTGNSIINGTVTIRVTATTTTTVFTDVPTTGSQAWAAPYISRLYSAGVVGGVTATTYGPKQAVKWGEALKMVLRGAGYPAQTEGTGSNWAANYLTYAYNNGLVSSNSINLNSNITRLEMAELAAKALKMSSASRINSGIVGPTDTTNGYVYALYNAGIVGGDSSSGQNRYNGSSSLNRDEMAKIVCGVMDHNG